MAWERGAGKGREGAEAVDVDYAFDPEDNRVELYYTTPYQVRQPFGETIDLDRPDPELLAFARSFEETKGPPRGAPSPVG
jgi:hypothetical protein